MENCVFSHVMTRRVSKRIEKQREGFLILVEEYSGTDSDSDSENEEDDNMDMPFKLHTRSQKLSTKQNTFLHNFIQVSPEDKNQISKSSPICYICNGTFDTVNELYFHGVAHSTQIVHCNNNNYEGECYKCEICNTVLKGKGGVRLHMSKHNFVRSQCTMCPKTFCSSSYLAQHIKHDHVGIKYTCPHCQKSYTQNTNLKQHMLSHQGIYFSCFHCGKDFTNRALLARHIGTHKENRKRYKCKICKRTMICPRVYKVHMDYHQGLTNYECHMCARKFINKHSLTQHMERHESPIEYKCNTCKRTYVNKKLFERHILRHFKENFVCKICGKAYVNQKVLDDHVLQHEGHIYQCDKCDKTFTYFANLKRHLKAHMKKRRIFECAICNVKLTTKTGLRYHLITHKTVRETVNCKMCSTVLKKKSYASHCKSVLHRENLKKKMIKLRRKVEC